MVERRAARPGRAHRPDERFGPLAGSQHRENIAEAGRQRRVVFDEHRGDPDRINGARIEALTGYNRAETEAAALLTIEPLIPYIDPTSPFAERRARQLAERRERAMPHRSTLVRWAIGAVDVRGATATVVAQETWSNQEVGVVSAEQATVRVTYTQRQDLATGRWLIVASSQMPL